MCWSVVNLLGATSLKKTDTLAAINFQQLGMWGLMGPPHFMVECCLVLSCTGLIQVSSVSSFVHGPVKFRRHCFAEVLPVLWIVILSHCKIKPSAMFPESWGKDMLYGGPSYGWTLHRQLFSALWQVWVVGTLPKNGVMWGEFWVLVRNFFFSRHRLVFGVCLYASPRCSGG